MQALLHNLKHKNPYLASKNQLARAVIKEETGDLQCPTTVVSTKKSVFDGR